MMALQFATLQNSVIAALARSTPGKTFVFPRLNEPPYFILWLFSSVQVNAPNEPYMPPRVGLISISITIRSSDSQRLQTKTQLIYARLPKIMSRTITGPQPPLKVSLEPSAMPVLFPSTRLDRHRANELSSLPGTTTTTPPTPPTKRRLLRVCHAIVE